MHFLATLVIAKLLQGDMLGKTEAQILAMGEEKWDALYGAKVGNSTAAMVEMNDIFGRAALHRNQALEKKSTPATRHRVEKLRKYMDRFARNAVELGYNLDGGGTMWASVSADIVAQTELAIYPILGGKVKKSVHVRTSDVREQLDGISSTLTAARKDTNAAPGFKYAEAKVTLAKMRAALPTLLDAVKGLSRANADHILGFCIEYEQMGNGDWG